MSLRDMGSERRFERYLDGLSEVMGHADRVGPLRDYCTGLMLPCDRKSVEPMAAATAPGRTSAQHQSLLHFVGQGAWSDEQVLCKVREMVLPEMERHGPIEGLTLRLQAQVPLQPAQFVDHIDLDPAHPQDGGLGNPTRPGPLVAVAPHRGHRGDGRQVIENGRVADVARVDDEVAAAQERLRLGPQQAVGVGDDADEILAQGHS